MTAIAILVVASSLALWLAGEATVRAAVRRRLTEVAAVGTVTEVQVAAPLPLPRLDSLAGRVLRARRDRLVERDLPDALDSIARSLRSGASLRQAFTDAARAAPSPLGDDLRAASADVADGLSLVDALRQWSARRPVAGVRLAAAALAMAAETGGASAQAIDGVATTLRTNLAIAGEVRALSSQARLSALVIVLAPVVFTSFAASTDGRTAAFLFGSPLGLLCLAVGGGLDALGWLWMRRITAVVA